VRNNTWLARFVHMKRLALAVKSGLKAGKLATNHSRTAIRVRTGLKAGRLSANHSRAVLP